MWRIRELWSVLHDAWVDADLGRRLRSWWQVVRGEVDPGSTVTVVGDDLRIPGRIHAVGWSYDDDRQYVEIDGEWYRVEL